MIACPVNAYEKDPATGIVTHPFLSDAFLDDVRHAAQTARDLGLRVDLTVGSGWPFGGPQVKIADAAGKLRIERSIVEPGSTRVRVPDIRTGERLLAALHERLDIVEAHLVETGPAIGAHAGRGALVASFQPVME